MINISMYKKLLPIIGLVFGLSSTGLTSFAQTKFATPPIMRENWAKDYPPFRIVGNVYYVGTYDLASYLITTPQGHILINTGLPGSAAMILRHIKVLGFKPTDIKILLATHAHYDHVGAMADIKKLTGAKLYINEQDAPVIADGGRSDYIFGSKGGTFAPVKADRLLHGDAVVKLGDMQIAVLHHPGHTKGACSFLFTVKDQRRSYQVLIANMPSILDGAKPGMKTYPNVAKDYAYTFNAMKRLQFDIFLASHASQFGLQQKHKPGDKYNPNVFMDRKGYDKMLNDLYKAYQTKLGKIKGKS